MSEPTQPSSYTFEVPAHTQVFVAAPARRRPYWLHLLLLVLTICTTLVVGARLQYNFAHNLPAFSADDFSLPLFPWRWILQQPSRLLMGLPFSVTLLGILLVHEFGHFIVAERNGVYATLPYFVPAPTLIGTFGALIRIKSPIRSRQALFDIGVAGPIAGFLVALPVLTWGLALSKPATGFAPTSALEFGYPLIFKLFHAMLVPFTRNPTSLDRLYLHPVGVAAWVGMFATALNLLPGGQFDGGHIIYALAPGAHKWVTRASIMTLVPLGWYCWDGWLVWAVILALTGWRHPRVPAWPGLDRARWQLVIVAALILILTFALAPIRGASLREILRGM
jgi:membrane-associated protease RseP (regulator of RpoE activity)